ncbi:MAG TPA: methyltransferase [Candidatus Moranbacteria bacterium]|nr:methyltransferase [Candidatus Moranbacteria bacterium]
MLSSENDAIRKVLENVDFEKASIFYDLGSGNGKLISQIANQYPHLKCTGIEYNVSSFCLSKIRNIFLKQKVDYKRKDFFKIDISDADIIYAYLFPGIMKSLENKFNQELKAGTLVVSTAFPIRSKEPKMIVRGEAGKLNTIYIYEY